MIYRFRIILDTKEDIFRDLEIEPSASLEDFHYAIAQSFGFGGQEMASFYTTNENWEQGEELPLLDMGEGTTPMASKSLDEFFNKENHHLIYVYDFLSMWTFFVELMEIGERDPVALYPNLIFGQGDVPEEVPDNNFDGEEGSKPEEEDEDDDLEDGILDYDDADFY
ncbi:plasmid pRiA4b ORF-3 family protein [Flavobacteriaceae bacterium]|nr:plasmid pRiA4b ORF-3 family protein [Flavobacteriaceae bacterium]MDA9184006.1 plasmid pRiA4b ORF-3 family protein [Flavobacteriaceae bacterium]MDA9294903.1 plasmid pRiA4b ORF-3 family protein [Flavobacteriaceae bacterium]MDA9330553.1 plasmid pRiA4b ORF-3 family protein [Flavobacteriaceae bacterium]MDA9886884.1 plasmid pRiA4b ORF-3 family protein [Flavobacteriaceae bacterium]